MQSLVCKVSVTVAQPVPGVVESDMIRAWWLSGVGGAELEKAEDGESGEGELGDVGEDRGGDVEVVGARLSGGGRLGKPRLKMVAGESTVDGSMMVGEEEVVVVEGSAARQEESAAELEIAVAKADAEAAPLTTADARASTGKLHG